jgi:HAD superfamily hydrolase (TIGR01509 family)
MKLNLPPGPFRAYLFDCDGTIVDSMPLHFIAWKTILNKWNCTLGKEQFYSWGGKPTREIIASLNEMWGLKMPVEEVAEEKEALYFDLLPQLKGIPEVLEIIEAEHGRIPFAVVSGGRHESVIRSLTALGLQDKFATIVGSEDYANSKPAPDCFLLAAERLGMKPCECLVFEDTEMGIESATAAGMASVKILEAWERSS